MPGDAINTGKGGQMTGGQMSVHRRPNVGAQGGGTATPAPGTVRCTVFRRGALSFDALPSQLICANLRVWQRGASVYAVSATPGSLCTDIWNGRALLEGIWVSTRCEFGSALVVPVGFWEDCSPATAPATALPPPALDAFLHLQP